MLAIVRLRNGNALLMKEVLNNVADEFLTCAPCVKATLETALALFPTHADIYKELYALLL